MSGYYCVAKENEITKVIEKSKFICSVKGISDEDDAKNYISQIKKRHSLANHYCYAYIADEKGLVQKFSDDGEPQGTAGIQILNALKNKKIYKTVAVVTRYFGGIKLGTGGLSRAYGGAANECLSETEISDMQEVEFYSLCLDYDGYVKFNNKNATCGFAVTETVFAENVLMKVAVRKEKETYFTEFKNFADNISKGNGVITKISDGYYDFKG